MQKHYDGNSVELQYFRFETVLLNSGLVTHSGSDVSVKGN
jgi:hypothetical protein